MRWVAQATALDLSQKLVCICFEGHDVWLTAPLQSGVMGEADHRRRPNEQRRCCLDPSDHRPRCRGKSDRVPLRNSIA
jgi:hypothetical protein